MVDIKEKRKEQMQKLHDQVQNLSSNPAFKSQTDQFAKRLADLSTSNDYAGDWASLYMDMKNFEKKNNVQPQPEPAAEHTAESKDELFEKYGNPKGEKAEPQDTNTQPQQEAPETENNAEPETPRNDDGGSYDKKGGIGDHIKAAWDDIKGSNKQPDDKKKPKQDVKPTKKAEPKLSGVRVTSSQVLAVNGKMDEKNSFDVSTFKEMAEKHKSRTVLKKNMKTLWKTGAVIAGLTALGFVPGGWFVVTYFASLAVGAYGVGKVAKRSISAKFSDNSQLVNRALKKAGKEGYEVGGASNGQQLSNQPSNKASVQQPRYMSAEHEKQEKLNRKYEAMAMYKDYKAEYDEAKALTASLEEMKPDAPELEELRKKEDEKLGAMLDVYQTAWGGHGFDDYVREKEREAKAKAKAAQQPVDNDAETQPADRAEPATSTMSNDDDGPDLTNNAAQVGETRSLGMVNAVDAGKLGNAINGVRNEYMDRVNKNNKMVKFGLQVGGLALAAAGVWMMFSPSGQQVGKDLLDTYYKFKPPQWTGLLEKTAVQWAPAIASLAVGIGINLPKRSKDPNALSNAQKLANVFVSPDEKKLEKLDMLKQQTAMLESGYGHSVTDKDIPLKAKEVLSPFPGAKNGQDVVDTVRTKITNKLS